MNTSALASILPGVAAWPGSNGKFGPTSIIPPMRGLSTCQSWMLEVPSILILLPDLAAIISDSRHEDAARHAEKPYTATKAQDLPGCHVRSSGVPSMQIRAFLSSQLVKIGRAH